MEEKEQDSLKAFKMNMEDPYPKHAKIRPNKPKYIRKFLQHIMSIIGSFFFNVWLASKELISQSLK